MERTKGACLAWYCWQYGINGCTTLSAAKSAGTLCLRLLGRLQAAPLKLIQLLLRLALWHQWVKSLWTRSFPFDLNLQLLEEASGCRPQQLPRSNRSLWHWHWHWLCWCNVSFDWLWPANFSMKRQKNGCWRHLKILNWLDIIPDLKTAYFGDCAQCQTNQAAFFKAAQKNGQEIDIP